MTLIHDRRDELDGPRLHALVAGVSHYPHLTGGGGSPAPEELEMGQLSSAAISAHKVAQWLIRRQDRLSTPLTSVRFLASPSTAEVAVEPALDQSERCTFENFRNSAAEWRADASARPDDTTVLYFAGHGAQRSSDDAVLLCEDYGDAIGDILERAFATSNLLNGMAPSPPRPQIARRQVYMLDACRIRAEAFGRYQSIATGRLWPGDLAGRDDRHTPLFFAAAPGTAAYGVPGEQTEFSRVLIWALDGAAADVTDDAGVERWSVSQYGLARVIADELFESTADEDEPQEFRPERLGREFAVHYLDDVPSVPLELRLEPEEALPYASVEVLDGTGTRPVDIPVPMQPNPYKVMLPAGVYTVSARISPPQPAFVDRPGRPLQLRPPKVLLTRRLSP
jgi:Caspase domain